jgi:Zn-dependent membrane protease YugP
MDHLKPDLNDPDTFAFDDDPDAFVILSVYPIVFTVRGIAYFTARFRSVGVDIGLVTTPDQFDAAYHAWTLLEADLLMASISEKAGSSHQASEHKVLLAALQHGMPEAMRQAEKLVHKCRANLKSV